MSGTVTIIIDADDLDSCPVCGQTLFEADLRVTNGPEQRVVVCKQCAIAWPIQEDD